MPTLVQNVSGDGGVWLQGFDTTYATARSTRTSAHFNVYFYVGQSLSGGNYAVNRSFLKFDTHLIPPDSQITRAYLTMVTMTDQSDTDFNIVICEHDWSAWDPLTVTASSAAAYTDAVSNAVPDVVWRNTSGMATQTPYQSPDLDQSWIEKGGSTYYCVRSSRDIANTSPADSVGEQIRIYGISDGDPEVLYIPALTVIWEPGAGETVVPAPTTNASGAWASRWGR